MSTPTSTPISSASHRTFALPLSLRPCGADTADLYGADWYLDALRSLRMPVTVLRAPRGLLDEPGGLYAPGRIDRILLDVPHARVIEVPDVNHYTILMSEPGAGTVADAIRTTQPKEQS